MANITKNLSMNKKRRLGARVSTKNVHKTVENLAAHGGNLSLGRRKVQRPLSFKKSICVVLSSQKARGQFSLASAPARLGVQKIIRRQGQKFGVRVEAIQNLGSRLQLKLRIKNRKNFQNFLRSTSAMIARYVTGARRGKPFGKFWDHLAFTFVCRPPWRVGSVGLHKALGFVEELLELIPGRAPPTRVTSGP